MSAAPLTLDEIRAIRWEPNPSTKAPGRWVAASQVRYLPPEKARLGWRLSRRDRGDLLERKVGPFTMVVRPLDRLRISFSISPGWWTRAGYVDGVMTGHPDEITIAAVERCEAAVVELGRQLIREVQR